MSEKSAVPTIIETSAAPCCGDDCCGGSKATASVPTGVSEPPPVTPSPVTPSPVTLSLATDPRAVVREKYGAVAQGGNCGCGCCGAEADDATALAALGYTDEQRAAIPEGADLGLGCGNPIAHAALVPGEVVIDLGSGGGIDCFLAAREVGATGHVIGVDMTPAMLERARGNLAKLKNAQNVEFRLGEIEHLPVADASVDAIISNCVVNLSPDKPQVFREALRVLKPGGRLVVSDLVLTRPLGEELRRNVDLYVGCVAGASQKDEYLELMRDAGFADVRILEERAYAVGMENLPAGSPEREAFAAVVSVKVRAVKR
jgi:SAM-dependent methyltransferase